MTSCQSHSDVNWRTRPVQVIGKDAVRQFSAGPAPLWCSSTGQAHARALSASGCRRVHGGGGCRGAVSGALESLAWPSSRFVVPHASRRDRRHARQSAPAAPCPRDRSCDLAAARRHLPLADRCAQHGGLHLNAVISTDPAAASAAADVVDRARATGDASTRLDRWLRAFHLDAYIVSPVISSLTVTPAGYPSITVPAGYDSNQPFAGDTAPERSRRTSGGGRRLAGARARRHAHLPWRQAHPTYVSSAWRRARSGHADRRPCNGPERNRFARVGR